MALLTCKDLSLGYDGQEIVRGLNFTVCAGDYLCIVGENGSGKTTLMKTILGLKQPMSGAVVTDEGLTPREIGYLPQQTQVQRDFPASVREIVLSGFVGQHGPRPFYSKDEKRTADENIRKMGIDKLSGRCYRELSGGQQQRVLLARALCATKKLLLLDEPVAGLDPNVTAELYRLIDGINKNDGITIIMISHDIETALKYASHILHIGDGFFFGTRREYLAATENRSFTAGGLA